MSISYPNLPGIEVNVNDGGLILPEDGTTESMLIIAPCSKPTVPADPVLTRQSSDGITNFGDYTDSTGVVNPLTAAWKAAFEGGNRRTYLLALNGAGVDADAKLKDAFLKLHGALFGSLADFTVDNVVLKDYFADVEVATPLAATDFTNPEDQANFPNVAGIIKYAYKVSSDTLEYPIVITTGTNDSLVVDDGTTPVTVTLTAKNYDGTNGKTLADLATDIQGDLTTLTGFKVVVEGNKLVILGTKTFTYNKGVTADASATLKFTDLTSAVRSRHDQGTLYVGNFAELLKDYCEDQTINHNTVKGFIGTSAPISNSLSNIKTNVDRLTALQNEYSGHISVIAGPELAYSVPGKNGMYYTNGVITYVALISTLKAESAPTNKPVNGVTGMNYSLSLRQMNALSGAKYVSFRLKNGFVYVTDGVTTAPDIVIGGQVNKSDYTRLSTLRITHAAINLVREIADPYVGEPNGIPQRNALKSAIDSGLQAMKRAGAITDYRFTIIQEGQSSVLGQAKITLQLVPAFETRKISVDVSLRPLL
jgi:hypothetical protein